jgi:hypothetical protein
MNLAKRLALLLAVPLAALVPLGLILHLQLRTIETAAGTWRICRSGGRHAS